MGDLLSQQLWSEFNLDVEEFRDGSSQVNQLNSLRRFTSSVSSCRRIFTGRSGCCSQESCADLIKPVRDG